MFEKLKGLLKKKENRSDALSDPADYGRGTPDVIEKKNSLKAQVEDKKGTPVKDTPAKGKHGLKVINKEMDLEALFEAEGEHEPPPPPKPKPRVRAPKPVKVAPKKKTNRTKNGILVLDGEGDILSQMADEAQREGDRVVAQPQKREIEPAAVLKKVQRDKNGLPILGEGDMPQADDAGDFASLLAASLSEKSEAVLLHEKKDREPARKMTLAEKLKRYPSVQAELDLHGYTSAKADQMTELYVRRAYSAGTYTIRIIVGKGLHSEHGAVLPDVIADRLTALKQDGIVLDWKWEKGKKAKSGAMIIYLNNYDTSRWQQG